jgi:hypothetical protein
MHDERDIVTELRNSGGRLWSSVECDVKRNHIVVYARLSVHPQTDLQHALAESERVLTSVMERRLDGGRSWLAAVQWSERLCKTFSPAASAATASLCELTREPACEGQPRLGAPEHEACRLRQDEE